MTNGEKYRQVRKEAGATGLALLVLIAFWLFAGFGLAGLDITVFHLPLWALTASIGVWLMAILLTKFLTAAIFRDMRLDDEEKEGARRG